MGKQSLTIDTSLLPEVCNQQYKALLHGEFWIEDDNDYICPHCKGARHPKTVTKHICTECGMWLKQPKERKE